MPGLTDKDWKTFAKVDRAMMREGFQAQLVGGSVRDHLLGVEPKDLDFAVNCRPEVANRLMLAMGYSTIPTGIKHGTITAVVDGIAVEITSLRVDVTTDGRHAEVEFTDDWKLDASRRDLTINSMFMDITGKITDYFGGEQDLRRGMIRFVGDPQKRIEEDYLRILRYFRFCSVMPSGDPTNTGAVNNDILIRTSKHLDKISGERIWSELTKILGGKNRVAVLHRMWRTYTLDAISTDLVYDDRTILKIQDLDANPRARSPLYFIAAMIPDSASLDRLRARLRFDTNSFKILYYIIQARNQMIHLDVETAEQALALGRDRDTLYHYAVFMGWSDVAQRLMFAGDVADIKFPVSGNDLKELGIPPGPDLGMKLKELRLMWAMSGRHLTRDELLAKIGDTCVPSEVPL